MVENKLGEALRDVAPGLAKNDLIPAFKSFCFNSNTVTSFDDQVAMSREVGDFGFAGMVQGEPLLAFLGSVSGDVQVLVSDGEHPLTFKVGRAKLRLGVADAKDFLFKRPTMDLCPSLIMTEDVTKGLLLCSSNMGLDPAKPHLLGVTVHFHKDCVTLYSTDYHTLTCVSVDLADVPKDLVDREFVLPPRFMQVLATCPGTGHWYIGDDCMTVEYTTGLYVYSRLLAEADVALYLKTMGQADDSYDNLTSVSRRLRRTIDRAAKMSTGDAETTLVVKDNKLALNTKSDQFEVGGSGKFTHPDVPVGRVKPDLFSQFVGGCQQMAVNERCIQFTSKEGNVIRLVAVTPYKE